MANSLYTQGKANLLAGNIDWDADTIKTSLVDGASYTPNTSTDDFYNDVSAGEAAVSSAMGSKTTTNGVADAADVTFSAVASGPACEYLVVWDDTTVPTTSPLICLYDTATGLPVTPNGGDITVTWNASGLFAL